MTVTSGMPRSRVMSTSLPDDFDPEKAARLAKTRRWAQGVLVALVGVYLATHIPDDPPTWVRLIRHMAEAGMIGGMADWFAVEALFRHPFGLKIPHTALLPRNQKRAAESVGQFFNSYFLDPASISARVAEMAPARRAAEWLVNADNAAFVAKPLTQALTVAMQPKDGVTLPKGLRQEIRSAVGSKDFTHALVSAMGPMLEKGLDGPFLNDTLGQVSAALNGNRAKVLEIVQDNSLWWAPTQVDKGVSNLLVDGVLGVIEDLQDPKSELRRDFEGGADGLSGSPERKRRFGAGRTRRKSGLCCLGDL